MENPELDTLASSSLPNSPRFPALHKYLPLIALILTLPVAFFAIRYNPNLSIFAKNSPCIPIARININPGKINTYLSAPPTQISVLAYSASDQPLRDQIQYQWGMSSTNSVGDLKPKQEIALFIPANSGTGNIWVNAKNSCTKTKIQASIPVSVSREIPLVTLVPTNYLSPTPSPAAHTPPPQLTVIKKVFISSLSVTGFLGGLSGADAECQRLATSVSLNGTWKAWLSSDTVSASSRLSRANATYKRIDGVTVANGWSDFTDGTLLAPINISETGSVINSSWVWTNTTAAGEIRQAENNSCLNWNSYSSGGGTGDSTRTDSGWSDYGASACIYGRPLYCIEQ